MGLFSGRREPQTQPQRAMTMPWDMATMYPGATITDYATVDANGENALRSIAVGTSIDLICSLGSELPVDVFRGEGSDRQRLRTPGNLEDPGDTGQGLEDWLYSLLQSWLYRGNVYGQVTEMSPNGLPRRVSWFHPDSVYPQIISGEVIWYVHGQQWDQPAMFVHRRVNPIAGRLLGMSVVERHAMQIGTSLAAAQLHIGRSRRSTLCTSRWPQKP